MIIYLIVLYGIGCVISELIVFLFCEGDCKIMAEMVVCVCVLFFGYGDISGDKAGSTYIKLANCHLKVYGILFIYLF